MKFFIFFLLCLPVHGFLANVKHLQQLYHDFPNGKPVPTLIYHDEMSCFYNNYEMVHKNKLLYISILNCLQKTVRTFYPNCSIRISKVSIVSDQCCIHWVLSSIDFLTISGHSLYSFDQKGLIKKHEIKINNRLFKKEVVEYTHPLLWKPIRVQK